MIGRLCSAKATAIVTVLACATLSATSFADHQNISVEPLAAYKKLAATGVTVSGISSGAFFAHQFHVAYSSLVKGAGIVAGGPFACADQVDSITPPFGNPFVLALVPRRVVASLAVCTHFGRSDFKQAGWQFPDKPVATDLQKAATRAHADGIIDDPSNLATSRVWLFHGDKDTGVPQSTMQQLKAFYQLMGVPAANVELKEGADAKHGMPIKALPFGEAGRHCKLPDSSFLVRCDYGAAELLLQHLYPGTPPVLGSPSGTRRIVGFDQTEFFDESDKSTSLNESGYLYVPPSCENGSNSGAVCRLHVAFHGCEQYVDKIHDLFFRDAGYNAWADANHIIVLYPQAAPWLRLADPSQITGNPKGCWDWWGYSGDDYLGQNGKQMRAVRGMIGRMLP
jgi:poly(3-hydroxybutyrate) depolymerase